MTAGFVVSLRPKRNHPMRTRRIGAVGAHGGASSGEAIPFPGSEMPDPEGGGRAWVTSGISLLVHGGAIALLLFIASQIPEEEKEKIIELILPEEVASEEEPAPAPTAIAESLAAFDPAPMAMAPQIVNPTVIQDFAQPVEAARIDTAVVAPTVAPTQVDFRSVTVETTGRVASVASATTAPVVPNYQGPALAGPIQHQAPVGVVSGPRQVVPSGNTIGTAGPNSLGSGSSVRQGIASSRDVFGADQGVVANPNMNLGRMGGAGVGGDGRGPGAVSFDACLARPEVNAYLARVKDRTLSRWILPEGVRTSTAKLRFRIDPAGSASGVSVVDSGSDPAAGKAAVEALLAASPFSHMGPQVRCLANHNLFGSFTNTLD